MTPHQAARHALANRVNPLPPKQDGTKAPDTYEWASRQRQMATNAEVTDWYSGGRTGVGVVCGEVSGNLEAIDFDDRSILVQYEKLASESGLEKLLNRVKAGYFEHTPNGAHLLYRCETIAGNSKLAKRSDKKTLIETKGEGGYLIVAPSHGSVNASGAYSMVSGGFAAIVTITPAERDLLHGIARAFDESITPEETVRHEATGSNRPGDEYNDRAAWREVLEPHGWALVSSSAGVARWRRPGKKHGISATTNHKGNGLLYVFSSNADPFEPERGYGKFSAYALLSHGGDFTQATAELYNLGFGVVPVVDEPDFSAILQECRGPETARERMGMDELLRVPGIIGDLAGWINATAIKPQPVLALGASIAACGTVLGQRVMTETRLRTNIYCLGVGHTGCGKENGRHCVKRLFTASDEGAMLGDSFGSGAGVEAAIKISSTCIYLVDEVEFLFRELKKDNAAAYLSDIVKVLLSLYGESSSSHQCRVLAKTDAKERDSMTVHNPCLSLWCTTVPTFYRAVTKEHMGNGLVSRFLVFESDSPDPYDQRPAEGSYAVPGELVDWVRWWRSQQGEGGDLRPEPVEVKATKSAWHEFDTLEAELRLLRSSLRAGEKDQGPYTRVRATAMKLALIRACGIGAGEVTEEDAAWGCDLAKLLACQFVERIESVGACESKVEDNRKRLLKVLSDAGPKGLPRSIICRRTQWLGKGDRDNLLKDIEESGLATVGRPPVGKRGPEIWVHFEFKS